MVFSFLFLVCCTFQTKYAAYALASAQSVFHKSSGVLRSGGVLRTVRCTAARSAATAGRYSAASTTKPRTDSTANTAEASPHHEYNTILEKREHNQNITENSNFLFDNEGLAFGCAFARW